MGRRTEDQGAVRKSRDDLKWRSRLEIRIGAVDGMIGLMSL